MKKPTPNKELIYRSEAYAIIGAGMSVYNELGNGFLEAVYQEALEIELTQRKIPFEPQKQLPVHYRGQLLKQTYKPDFVCYGKIIVEIKALSQLTSKEESQILNYLKASKLKLGLLLNFGSQTMMQYRRRINGWEEIK